MFLWAMARNPSNLELAAFLDYLILRFIHYNTLKKLRIFQCSNEIKSIYCHYLKNLLYFYNVFVSAYYGVSSSS